MKKVLQRSAEHCQGSAELFKIVICLICCTREGLEAPGPELSTCLETSRTKGRIGNFTVLQLRDAIKLLDPFVRCKGNLLAPRSCMVEKAVRDAFLADDEGKERKALIQDLLFATFFVFDTSTTPTPRAVTSRQAQELPFVLLAQVEALKEELKQADAGKLPPFKVLLLEEEQRHKRGLLKAFLHRLDVFLHFYQQDNPRVLTRFKDVVPLEEYVDHQGEVCPGLGTCAAC